MKRYYKTIKWIVQVLITVVLMFLALRQLDTEKLRNILDDINAWPLLAAPVFLFADLLINSYRVRSLYRFYGLSTRLSDICLVKFHGFFFSLVFPLLGDAYKVQAFKTLYGASYGKNTLVVLLDRLIYSFGLTLILVPVWLFGVIRMEMIFTLSIIVLLVAEVIILYLVNNPELVKIIVSRWGKMIRKILKNPISYNYHKGFTLEIAKNTLAAILRHTLIAVLYLVIALTVLHTISFNVLLFILVVFSIMLSRILPVSVGGIGLREYIAVMVFPQIGVPSEYAFTIAFIMSSLMILQGIAGGTSFLLHRIIKMSNLSAHNNG